MLHIDVKPIPEFPNYDVTVDGRVFNAITQREMTLSPTMQGELTVGLVRDDEMDDGSIKRVQHRRSVKVLVAQAFVDGESDMFDTPILLDLDKHHLHASNIQWRPRWFAWRYARQFINPENWYYIGPILDLVSGVQYQTIMEASIANGLLCKDVRLSLLNEERVFPTDQIFVYI